MLKWGTTCDAFVTNYFVTNSMPKVVNSRGTVVTLSYPEFPSVFVQQRDPPSLLSPPSYPNSYSRQLLVIHCQVRGTKEAMPRVAHINARALSEHLTHSRQPESQCTQTSFMFNQPLVS